MCVLLSLERHCVCVCVCVCVCCAVSRGTVNVLNSLEGHFVCSAQSIEAVFLYCTF